MKKKLLALLIGLFITVPAFASVGVSPMKIEINANKVRGNYATAAVEIKGDPQKPMRFKVYPEYFTINSKSEMEMFEKSDSPFNLMKKLRYVPSEFTVLPGKVQKLRINIPNLNTLPDGESRAVLFIEDINPKEFNIPTGQAGIGAQLIVKTRLGVPVYVDKGKVNKVAEIEYFKVNKVKDKYQTEMKILSKGNSKVRYTGKIQIVQDKKLIGEYNINDNVVALQNFYIDKTDVDMSKIKGNGEFTLKAVISYYDENGKRKNITKETVLNI